MPAYHKEYPATCGRCGKEFICHSARRKWCDECIPIISREHNRIWEAKRRRKPINTEKKSKSLNDYVKAAMETGMSYGKYMAMKYEEQRYE